MIDEKNYSLKHHNTFGVDALCARYIEYESVEELQQFLRQRPADIPFFRLVRGVICCLQRIMRVLSCILILRV